MELIDGIVSDKDGDILKEKGKHSYYVTEADVKDPYRFYVKGNKELTVDGQQTTVYQVQMVSPLGGTESGLFRFPKVGERVLVAFTDGVFYMMGYVPSANAPFNGVTDQGEETEGILEAQGEVFRFKKTGENNADDEYSEIGFYNAQTQWKGGKDDACPKIDRINIQSTGDIRSKAENHHQVKAKRFELLAGCDEADHSDANAPAALDTGGDDSALYAGDAHVRAKNRIVIKAGQEILLQVGRSAVVISDDGITLTTKKSSNRAATPWDTVINLTPRDGISMAGQELNMGAAYSFSLTEGGGGTLSSFGGILRLTARDLMAKAYCGIKYAARFAGLGTRGAKVLSAMKQPPDEKLPAGETPSFSSLLPSLVGTFVNENWGYWASNTGISDPYGDFANYCGMYLHMLNLTYTALDMSRGAERGAISRDDLIYACTADELEDVCNMLTRISAAAGADTALFGSMLNLTAGGDAVMMGNLIKRLSNAIEDYSCPEAAPDPAADSALNQKMDQARNSLAGDIQQVEGNAYWAIDIAPDQLNAIKEL
ncbi:hypothetical protein AGMMS49546_35410 [Spirochaetia bacterium]|nr:hypothetical protein AGMMS49546_35410 [Spirochaetia bacterium]